MSAEPPIAAPTSAAAPAPAAEPRLRRGFWLSGRGAVTAVPYFWLFLFFLVPFAIVLKISLAQPIIAQPPFTPLFGLDGSLQASLDNYRFLWEDSLYLVAYLNSMKLAAISTLLCLAIGYPMAYGMAKAPPSIRNILLLLVILPFWTSFLLRVYAWMGILRNNGLINNTLIWLGVIDQPIQMMNTDFAIYIGITYSYLPFMILPLYAALERLDPDLVEAAQDLGCKPWKAFATITLPLSIPGIVAGSLLVFIPAVGEFVIPSLLGGPDSLMIGRVLWDEFFGNRDWPVASAVAIALLLFLVVPIMLFQRMQLRRQGS